MSAGMASVDMVQKIHSKVSSQQLIWASETTSPVYTVMGVCFLLLSAPFVWWNEERYAIVWRVRRALRSAVVDVVADAECGDMQVAAHGNDSESENGFNVEYVPPGATARPGGASKAISSDALVYMCAHTELPDPVLDHDVGVSFHNCSRRTEL